MRLIITASLAAPLATPLATPLALTSNNREIKQRHKVGFIIVSLVNTELRADTQTDRLTEEVPPLMVTSGTDSALTQKAYFSCLNLYLKHLIIFNFRLLIQAPKLSLWRSCDHICPVKLQTAVAAHLFSHCVEAGPLRWEKVSLCASFLFFFRPFMKIVLRFFSFYIEANFFCA